MKKILHKLSLIAVALLVFASACEKERIMFDSSMNVVGFSSASLTITEDGSGGSIMVYLGAPSGTSAATVTLEVSSEGMDNPAVEGTDFTIATKEVSTAVGETAVAITPIDNDIFTGDKTFTVTIASSTGGYKIANEKTVTVTISDNEHPLKNWIGTYSVAAASYGNPGAWDEAWTVETSPVEGDISLLQMVGVGEDGSQAIIATLDTDAGTITIAPGQSLGTIYGGYVIGVFLGTPELVIPDKDAALTGTISEDGTISVDLWAHEITEGDYTGYVWDTFNTTWTKQ